MRVTIVADHEDMGGAAIAANRLAQGLFDRGVDVSWIVHKASPNPRRPWDVRVGAFDRNLAELRPDVINIHNIHGAWGPEIVETCLRHAPVVWTLHDMWSFTGRCAYSYDCAKFMTGCDAECPTPDEYPALKPELIRGAWHRRREILARHPEITAVAPSRWMTEQAGLGLWKGHRIEHIPYGLPLDTYRVRDRLEARKELGLPAAGTIALIAAQNLWERRKGVHLLPPMPDGVHLAAIGRENRDLAADSWLGFVTEESGMVAAYNAADFLIHPAPVDNLPLVVMESIACGTPVVGQPIGGMPDLVRPGETGWLSDSLAEGIGAVRGNLRGSCRRVAEGEWGMDLQAKRTLELFTDVSSRRRSA